jgi:hypothetical protein
MAGCGTVNRAVVIALVALATWHVAGPAAAAEEVTVRVVLLAWPEQQPAAAAVQTELTEQLSSVGVRVDVHEVEQAPADAGAWAGHADDAAEDQPGTLALIGWTCAGGQCSLVVIESRGLARAEIPLSPIDDSEHAGDLGFAVAAASREVVVGSLLPELGRLVTEGENPSLPPPTADRVPQAYAPESAPDAAGPRPTVWIEGGYHGEHPYPQGRPLHGAWVGLVFAPRRTVLPFLTVGWLGMQEGSNERGVVRSHRLPIDLGLRIAFPVGPATFALAPVARLDVVFVKADPTGPRGAGTKAEIELHVGGQTTWHLPLPGGIEAVLGAGILGTLLGRDYEVDEMVAIPKSALRFGWWIGIAWAPLSQR